MNWLETAKNVVKNRPPKDPSWEGKKRPPLDPVQKYSEKPTALKAIQAQCCLCMGYPSRDYREYIRNCTSGPNSTSPCALYDYRPYKRND